MRWPARTHRRGDRRREEAREGGCEGEDSCCHVNVQVSGCMFLLEKSELRSYITAPASHIQTHDTDNIRVHTLTHAEVKYLTSTAKDSVSSLNVPSWVKRLKSFLLVSAQYQ